MNKSENNKANFRIWKSKKSWIYGASVLTILTGTASPVISSLAESQADKTVATSSTQENVEATSTISIAPITTSTEPSNGEETTTEVAKDTTQGEIGTGLRPTSEENKVTIQTNTSEDTSTSEEAPETSVIDVPTENQDNDKTTTEILPNGREITTRSDGSILSISYKDEMKDVNFFYILRHTDGSQENLENSTMKDIYFWYEQYAKDGKTITSQGWAGGLGGGIEGTIAQKYGVKFIKREVSFDFNNQKRDDVFNVYSYFINENENKPTIPSSTSTPTESSSTSNSQAISSSSSSQTNTTTSTSNKPNSSTSTSDKSTSTSNSQNTSSSSSNQTNSSTSISNKPNPSTSTSDKSTNTSSSQNSSSSSSSQTNSSVSTSNQPNSSTSTSDKSTSTSSIQNPSSSSSSQINTTTSTSNQPNTDTSTSINTTTNLTSKSTDKNHKKHDISSNKAELPKTGENSFISNLLIALGFSGLVGASILNKKKG